MHVLASPGRWPKTTHLISPLWSGTTNFAQKHVHASATSLFNPFEFKCVWCKASGDSESGFLNPGLEHVATVISAALLVWRSLVRPQNTRQPAVSKSIKSCWHLAPSNYGSLPSYIQVVHELGVLGGSWFMMYQAMTANVEASPSKSKNQNQKTVLHCFIIMFRIAIAMFGN